jgi:branched-chain amino acid transport system substrate-binding protein
VKKFNTALVGVALAALVAGCGVTDTGANESTPDTAGIDHDNKTASIGSFIPETGPVPSYKLIAEGSKAYFDFVNANGGINGYTFDYTQVDDGYDPSKSFAAARRLVRDHDIFSLVAPIGTPTNAAVQPFAEKEGIPVIGPVSGDPEIRTLPNYFALLPSYVDEAKLVTTYAVEELGAERVVVMYENDDLGKPALEGAKEALESVGMKLAASIAFNVSDTDLTAQITKAKQANADATLIWGSNSNVATAVTTAERIGFDTQFFAPFYVADPQTYELAGDALDGTMFGSWLLPSTSDEGSIPDYRDAMAKYGRESDIGVFSLNGWTNAALFGEAFREITGGGEDPTREALLEALEAFDERAVGAAPEVTFSDGDHNGTKSLSIIQADGGEFTAITEPIPFEE